ncbi:chloride conductance regulatory protein ICln [Oryza brachyantha]|uniref:Chloride conductance regulatory protein ICln n=1 Tax=Oryza brachyantha TaxID=4533 RepID=J3N189_ORYBR|nr:chloride conductance regulatory protein ICln [Oryza brachyantha]
MVLGLYPFVDIAADGAPRLNAAAGEELVRVERATAVALGPRTPEPAGTLFITTRRVIWLSEVEKGKGYAVDFLAVSLHAVSRDPEAYPSPCIYTQIETEDGSDEESDESDSEANREIDLAKVTEMRIIPSNPCQLDGLFEAFSHCAELNPDPNAESDEENGWAHGNEGDEDMTDGSDAECEFSDVNPIGQTDAHDITHAVVELQINDQRFEDAEEAEHDTRGNGH